MWLIYRSQSHHLIEKKDDKKRRRRRSIETVRKHCQINCDLFIMSNYRAVFDFIAAMISLNIDLGHASDVSDGQAIEHHGSVFFHAQKRLLLLLIINGETHGKL